MSPLSMHDVMFIICSALFLSGTLLHLTPEKCFNAARFSSGERGRGRRPHLRLSSLHAGFQQPWEAHLPCLPGENNIVSPVLIWYRTMKTRQLQSPLKPLSSFQHRYFSEMQVEGEGVDLRSGAYFVMWPHRSLANKMVFSQWCLSWGLLYTWWW